MQESETAFDQWCVVELFGHQVIAGRVSEQVLGGSAMLRVDVPAYDGQAAYTRFFGHGAIYSITPVSEEIALAYVMRYRPRPIDVVVRADESPRSQDRLCPNRVIQSVALPEKASYQGVYSDPDMENDDGGDDYGGVGAASAEEEEEF